MRSFLVTLGLSIAVCAWAGSAALAGTATGLATTEAAAEPAPVQSEPAPPPASEQITPPAVDPPPAPPVTPPTDPVVTAPEPSDPVVAPPPAPEPVLVGDGAYTPPPPSSGAVTAVAPVETITDHIAPASGPDAPSIGVVAASAARNAPAGAGTLPGPTPPPATPTASPDAPATTAPSASRNLVLASPASAAPDLPVLTLTHSQAASTSGQTTPPTKAAAASDNVLTAPSFGVHGQNAPTLVSIAGRSMAPPTEGAERREIPAFLSAPKADPATSTTLAPPAFGMGAGASGSSILRLLANYVFPAGNNTTGTFLLLLPLAFLVAAFAPRAPRLYLQTLVAQSGAGCPGFNPVQLRPG